MATNLAYNLAENHEGLDPWFYEVDIHPSSFGEVSAYIPDGMRTVQRVEVDGQPAYRKWDSAPLKGKPRLDGARDKVAADLAQLVGANVPAVLLWSMQDEVGCIQKEPPHFTQNLKLFLAACEVAADGEAMLRDLASTYDLINVFLDVWVCNRDRFANYKNTLVCESNSSILAWIIDFNGAMGPLHHPWQLSSAQQHELDLREPPIPQAFLEARDWREVLAREADNMERRLLAVPEETLGYLCSRAFCHNAQQGGQELADLVSTVLKERRMKVKEWTNSLLISSR